jgi:hypothetical protein
LRHNGWEFRGEGARSSNWSVPAKHTERRTDGGVEVGELVGGRHQWGGAENWRADEIKTSEEAKKGDSAEKKKEHEFVGGKSTMTARPKEKTLRRKRLKGAKGREGQGGLTTGEAGAKWTFDLPRTTNDSLLHDSRDGCR